MESELIAWLRENAVGHDRLRLGIGDDAAALSPSADRETIVTADMLAEGVHFELGLSDPEAVGYKALAVNLSDIAAMAARPLAFFVTLMLPRQGGLELARALYEGMLPLAKRYDVALAGGDTNSWPGPLVVSITLIGESGPGEPWRRDGARPGDRILVTGEFGGSLLGRHLNFEPRVDEAQRIAERYEVRAAVDVSDGLSLDLSRVANESGCGAVVELDRVPIAPDTHELAARPDDTHSPLEHALGDGEDFELLLAVERKEAERMLSDHSLGVTLSDIGEFTTHEGLWSLDATGERKTLQPCGFEHRLES